MTEKLALMAQVTQASGEKIRALTRLSELIRRRPGEAVAMYANLSDHKMTLEISQNDEIAKDDQSHMAKNIISNQE